MIDKKPTTISDEAFASNPGKIALNPFIWVRYHPMALVVQIAAILASIWIIIYISWLLFFILAWTIQFSYRYWKRRQEHFIYGDSNPGVVVSSNPTLVAVATNLTKGIGNYPVVKIIPYKGELAVGTKVATVALYSTTQHCQLMHWLDFDPIPINYATNDTDKIAAAFESYDSDQWQNLTDYLKQVPTPYHVGIYKITGGDNDWPD